MRIQTKLFSSGMKILLSRNGNSSVMQVIGSLGNVIKTRCKSISRTTVPISTDVPVRTSIGFIPQQLRSHVNDRTRLQIGFRLSGEKPKKFKTDIKRNKFITVTKTDFNENFDIVNVSSLQRQYNPQGIHTGTVPVGNTSAKQIAELNQLQRKIIIDTLENHKITINNYQNQLNKIDLIIKEYQTTTDNMNELVNLRKQMLAINKAETENYFASGMFLDICGNYWKNEVAPIIRNSQFPQFSVNPCQETELILKVKLDKLIKEKEQLEKLLKTEQAELNQRIEFIQPVMQQRDAFANTLELMKSHCTNAENDMRKFLCSIQREITSIVTSR